MFFTLYFLRVATSKTRELKFANLKRNFAFKNGLKCLSGSLNDRQTSLKTPMNVFLFMLPNDFDNASHGG